MSDLKLFQIQKMQRAYTNMWRLFDMDYTGNADDYPEDSFLRRNFKQYIKDGGRTGVGLGVFFI